jgi:hypothetical protein
MNSLIKLKYERKITEEDIKNIGDSKSKNKNKKRIFKSGGRN